MRAHRGFFARHSEPDISAHREFYARGGDVDDDFQQYHVVQYATGGGVIKTIAELFKPGIRDRFGGKAGEAIRDVINETRQTGNEAGRIGNSNFVSLPLAGDRLSVDMTKQANGSNSSLPTFVQDQYLRSNDPWFSVHTHPPRYGQADGGAGAPFSFLDDETRQRAQSIPGFAHPSGIPGDLEFWYNKNPNRHLMLVNPTQENATVSIGDPSARLGTDPRLREKVVSAASAGASPDPSGIWKEINRIYGFPEDEPNIRAYDQVRRMRQASDLPMSIDEAATFGDKGGTVKDALQDYYRMLNPDFAEGGSVDDDMSLYHPIAFGGGGSLTAALKLAGRVFRGSTHEDALERARQAGVALDHADDAGQHGFIDHRGRYLDRTQAMDYARMNGMVDEDMIEGPELISEWLTPHRDFAEGGHFARCYGGEVYG